MEEKQFFVVTVQDLQLLENSIKTYLLFNVTKSLVN